ncbi:MAG: 2-C-methyl-D-erythritol 4-phosphate cytidylyltransferase [Pseudomonadales bacterium 32-61-5]|nr:MAG: 2-C-methyl-D-erythritol 4-phosphate cytidylyltransferase [Pseudomonadales bacterium 32-61-5]
MSKHPSFWVVIPAAGVGSRMRADRPKQYLQLADRTILEHTLDCFLGHPGLKGMVVSLAADDPWWPSLGYASDPRIRRAEGGVERADSVLGGLRLLSELGAGADDWVLVHDAARPTVDRSVIWQAYTPQMFRFSALQEALVGALAENVAITDEASALEWAGQSPRLIEGRADNLKITRPEDLQWLQQRWKS